MVLTHFNKRAFLLATLVPIMLLSSCGPKKSPPEVRSENSSISQDPGRAVYFWQTRFDLNESELKFLKTYSIGKMYVRMFDVDFDTSPAAGPEKVIPVATTAFISKKPEGVEIIPTVFITTRAIKAATAEEGGMDALAGKIVLRVKNMIDYNEIGPFSELQLDCDWTSSTKKDFYALCSKVKALLKTEGKRLSATIRLHQLRQDSPPVDRGVLMVYNTGSFRRPGTGNSIISSEDAGKYIKGKPVRYKLPLDFAYPLFRWGVWFRGGTFMALLHRGDFSDAERYRSCDDGTFEVLEDHVLEGHQLLRGDIIRAEHADYTEILATMELVRKCFPDSPHRNILYHLDSENIKEYTADEITRIFGN